MSCDKILKRIEINSFALLSYEIKQMTFIKIMETVVVLSLVFTIGEAFHRFYLHPLAHIPGPKLAALTSWYEFYFDVVRQWKYVFEIQGLHEEYGGF